LESEEENRIAEKQIHTQAFPGAAKVKGRPLIYSIFASQEGSSHCPLKITVECPQLYCLCLKVEPEQ
jgi:hypothetical protein